VVKVKICGLRRLEEAETALEEGADFLGFVFYPPSPRYLAPAEAAALIASLRARPGGRPWAAVGVFVNEPADLVNETADRCGLDFVQLHGTEPAAYCTQMRRPVIKALRLAEVGSRAARAADYGAVRLLLDAQVPGYWGGTGVRVDWAAARPHAGEALIAGGLTPANVQEAIETLRPWGLDVSSGVERDGTKDVALIRAFLRRARGIEESS
jgi:indole-3-glycerol phosphate synthase / phosphoribosylanthranilate isomerase